MKIKLNDVMPEPLIGASGISDTNWPLNNTFEKEKFYLISSPSGRGKTSLIHIIYGIRRDFKGTAEIDDQEVRSISMMKTAELRRGRLSIVFQDLRLFSDLTAFENIELKNSLTDTADDEEIRRMAELLGVGHLLDKKTGKMSFGERQRIAIIRSLVQPFDFLLMDEPFSHLDRDNIRKAAELINDECRKRDAGLLLTSLGENDFFDFNETIKL